MRLPVQLPASHAPEHPDNLALVEFARREMGTAVRIENCSRDFGRPSIVWRLLPRDGSRAWLKKHESSRLRARELLGLESFVPALGEPRAWSTPTLIATDEETGALAMTDVLGTAVDVPGLPLDEAVAAHRLAGGFARGLHDLDLPDPDTSDAALELRRRLSHSLRLGESHVDARTASWARELIDATCCTSGLRRVPCQMDFSPRNWLIQRKDIGAILGVIDWERARWDLWLHDVQRMVYDHWHGRPELRDAYFEGYGRELTPAEELQLDTICLVNAIVSIPWAIDDGDRTFAQLSREQIVRIRQTLQ